MTDDVYESLIREAKAIEKEFPQLSITGEFDRVAGKPLDAFVKVTHSTRMLSLNDVFSIAELKEIGVARVSIGPQLMMILIRIAVRGSGAGTRVPRQRLRRLDRPREEQEERSRGHQPQHNDAGQDAPDQKPGETHGRSLPQC